MKLKHNLVGAGLIVALSVGAAVPVASTASSERATVTQTVAAGTSVHSSGTSGALQTAPVGRTAGVPVESSNQQAGALARAFIAAVKKWGASAYKAMVKALKSGYKAFTKWLGTVPGWVKNTVGTLGTSALYDWLKDILGL